jgi:hypothetical protein
MRVQQATYSVLLMPKLKQKELYSKQQLVAFVLSGLSNTKNMKYETAIQLYNLELENGKTFTLEGIEKKFFSIDEKIA